MAAKEEVKDLGSQVIRRIIREVLSWLSHNEPG